MLVEFSTIPLGTTHMSDDIAQVMEILDTDGVQYHLGPMSTSLEGDWDHIFNLIHRCHERLLERHERVITTITIDDRKTNPHTLDQMVQKVETARRQAHLLTLTESER